MPDDMGIGPEIEPVEVPEPPEWEWKRPESVPEKPPMPDSRVYSRGMGLAIAIGSSFLGPVLGGLLIGYLLDGRVGGTWGIIGLLAGTVVAFVLLIRLVAKLNEEA